MNKISMKDGEIVSVPIERVSLKLSPEDLDKANKRFDWLISFMIIRYHYVHKILGSMHRTIDYNRETMGVRISNGRMALSYNPNWFDALPDPQATFVFIHECMHVLLHHCTTRSLGDTELANIAQDLAINSIVPEIPGICERPRNDDGSLMGCFVDVYKKQPMFSDIEEKQSSDWYFEYLRKKQKEKNGGTGELGTSMDDHSGHCEDELADERARQLVKEIEDGNLWGDMSQTDREVVLAAQVRRINWSNKLRTSIGNCVFKDRQATRLRPNRRMGYIFPGTRKSYTIPWLIVIDVSGSTWGYDLLGQFLNVINQIQEEGIPIDLVQLDCAILDGPKTYDRKRSKFEFSGKGGTCFEPAMRLIDEKKYGGACILTDGEAAAPSKPRHAKIIWCLPKGKHPPVEWGDRVYLERK
jgi:predicted metal-dependent peptidase